MWLTLKLMTIRLKTRMPPCGRVNSVFPFVSPSYGSPIRGVLQEDEDDWLAESNKMNQCGLLRAQSERQSSIRVILDFYIFKAKYCIRYWKLLTIREALFWYDLGADTQPELTEQTSNQGPPSCNLWSRLSATISWDVKVKSRPEAHLR